MFVFKDPTVIPHLMSLLSNSLRTQEYITQIFSHCCKVFVGVWSPINTLDTIAQSLFWPRLIADLRFVVFRPQSTRRFFSIMAPSRTLPLCLFHLLIRYNESVQVYAVGWYGTWYTVFCDLRISSSLFDLITCPGPDAGVKVFLSPGIWEHSGLHDTGEW